VTLRNNPGNNQARKPTEHQRQATGEPRGEPRGKPGQTAGNRENGTREQETGDRNGGETKKQGSGGTKAAGEIFFYKT